MKILHYLAGRAGGLLVGRLGGISGNPRAWYKSVREFEPHRVHTRINSLGLFVVDKLTCGKRELAIRRTLDENRRAVGLLNPTRDKSWRQEQGRRRVDTSCDHGLSRSWKVEV